MSSMVSLSEQEQQFLDAAVQAIESNSFDRLILSQYKGEIAELEKMTFRVILLQGERVLTCLYKYKTQDITKNYVLQDALGVIQPLLECCKQANLFTANAEIQLKKNKKKAMLTTSKIKPAEKAHTSTHDREKNRYVIQDRPFLKYLGITDEKAQIVPSMARKWKQINKFVEIFSGAFDQINAEQEQIRVVDFGSGKGYLTFALYDYLKEQKHKIPRITGVELRNNLVDFCQDISAKVAFEHLDFFEGDVRTYHPEKLDVMIALHACDIATDFAIHTGIRLNASMIMCAPCCHKELRPQLKSPDILKPMLQFGIHAGQQAEMLTDTIRALLLKAYGYETKVFEFVSLEHTSKNKMILATKRKNFTAPDVKVLAQIEALKDMYGIKKHTLQQLLNDQFEIHDIGCKC
ncbi:class I SAM-dependent methyltransferase [Acinetobacter stercoris]|uniref:Methyltransferase TRM13 n=1 Tax=Acinetobacter stercoris TaxID=2126983 RepID=A0A2U3MW37_9GAMM|nr:SAM-dependent methyltransferase [Acinetobacter stercoris]SPL69626.1 Methyltransferase TRM13 [Acinetobacter stercoris]